MNPDAPTPQPPSPAQRIEQAIENFPCNFHSLTPDHWCSCCNQNYVYANGHKPGCLWKRHHDAALATVRAALKEMEDAHEADAEIPLKNLLARIHRDGGHHTDGFGVLKSCRDAETKVCRWVLLESENEAETLRLIEANRVIAELEAEVKALKAERAQAVARIEALRPSPLECKADPRKDAFDDAIDATLKALKGEQA